MRSIQALLVDIWHDSILHNIWPTFGQKRLYSLSTSLITFALIPGEVLMLQQHVHCAILKVIGMSDDNTPWSWFEYLQNPMGVGVYENFLSVGNNRWYICMNHRWAT
jgi:hypothetical protein